MNAAPLRVVEAAYADVADDRRWLAGVANAALPLLDDGLGLYVSVYTLRASGEPVRSTFVSAGDVVDAKRRQQAIDRNAPREILVAAFGRSQISTVTEFHGRPPDAATHWVTDQLVPYGARDVAGLVTINPNGLGLSIAVPLRTPRIVTDAYRERWSRVMAHVGAGLRLRRRADHDEDEAILDPSGKLHDAKPPARSREARAALRCAARAIDRARAKLRSAPDDALAEWRALSDGRWSIVDRFESDGRRFLVARRNPPLPTRRPRQLTEREACAVALAAHGRSNKLIAYELGVSIGTVGTMLSRAAEKLGVGSRALLVREWNRRTR